METIPHKKRRDNTSLNQDMEMTHKRLAVLRHLNDFHLLDTKALYDLVVKERGETHYGRFQNDLTALRNKGGYITCPGGTAGQFNTINADYKRLVYRLTERGENALRHYGTPIHRW